MNKPKESAASKAVYHVGLTVLVGLAVVTSTIANDPGSHPGFSFLAVLTGLTGLWFAMRAPD